MSTTHLPQRSICCSHLISAISHLTSLGNAIQAFGNGTDVGVWQPMSPVQTTTSTTTPYQRNRERNPNTIDNNINPDPGIYHFCGSLQVRHARTDTTVFRGSQCALSDLLIFLSFSISLTFHISTVSGHI